MADALALDDVALEFWLGQAERIAKATRGDHDDGGDFDTDE